MLFHGHPLNFESQLKSKCFFRVSHRLTLCFSESESYCVTYILYFVASDSILLTCKIRM